MKILGRSLIVGAVLVSGGPLWAHEEHAHEMSAPVEGTASPASGVEQTLTGEVVDVFCYLSHGPDGLGKGHAACAKKCIQNGLPVAIKVGDQLYLASMADHLPANASLGKFAGQQVTVRGNVMERDGQHLIAVTSVEPSP